MVLQALECGGVEETGRGKAKPEPAQGWGRDRKSGSPEARGRSEP